MQDIVGRAWASCMHFSHQREHEVSKVAWGDNTCWKFAVAHSWQFSWAYSVHYHVSITFQHFLPGLVCLLFGFVLCSFYTFSGRSLLMHFFWHRAMPSSTSCANCISMVPSVTFMCCVLYESDLRYGVTDWHCSTTNSVGLAREHDWVGLAHACPTIPHGWKED